MAATSQQEQENIDDSLLNTRQVCSQIAQTMQQEVDNSNIQPQPQSQSSHKHHHHKHGHHHNKNKESVSEVNGQEEESTQENPTAKDDVATPEKGCTTAKEGKECKETIIKRPGTYDLIPRKQG